MWVRNKERSVLQYWWYFWSPNLLWNLNVAYHICSSEEKFFCADACRLTLDPNTANTCLLLTASNTRMSLQTEHRPCQDHRQRFEHVKQVLCRERLSGRCYWEVEWHGSASIAVVYKTISKRGHRIDCEFGQSKKSWSLNLYPERCIVVHNKKKIVLSRPQGNAIGVYVDYPAGILSFYAISSDTHTRIHTFHTTFMETLFAGFGLNSTESFISLIRSWN